MKKSVHALLRAARNAVQAWLGRVFAPISSALPESEEERQRPALPRRPLVAKRPASLEQRYELLDHDELGAEVGDEVFRRLQRHVYAALDRHQNASANRRPPTVFREAGRLAPGRPYFFVQQRNRSGWLIERSGAGWVVSQADKIAERQLFLRHGDPLDAAVLYLAKNGNAFPRVRSPLLGGELISFAVYEQKLLEHLGIPLA